MTSMSILEKTDGKQVHPGNAYLKINGFETAAVTT
jgi:hypothetical protein